MSCTVVEDDVPFTPGIVELARRAKREMDDALGKVAGYRIWWSMSCDLATRSLEGILDENAISSIRSKKIKRECGILRGNLDTEPKVAAGIQNYRTRMCS